MTSKHSIAGSRGEVAPYLGVGGSALAAVLWGFGGIFATLCTAPGLVLTFYRCWLGAGLLVAMLYLTGRRLTWSALRTSLLGGVCLAGDMALFFSSVKLTSVVVATVIGAFQPALVFIIARSMFGERLPPRDGWLVMLAIAGVTVTVFGSGFHGRHQVAGDVLAVGSLLCWTAYWLVSKKVRQHHDALEYTAGLTIVAAVVMTPVVLLSGQSLGRVHAGDWLWISLLAVVPGSGHLVMNWAHRYVDASVSSAIGNLNPLVAAVAAIPILGQSLTSVQWAGVIAGLGAIAVIALDHRGALGEVPR